MEKQQLNGLTEAVTEIKAYDEQNGYIRQDDTVGTIMTDGSSPKHNNRIIEIDQRCRIRKLTPRECWRLMGFDDTDYDKAAAVVSGNQLYKQRGNSIVVQVLENVFRQFTNKVEHRREEITFYDAPFYVVDKPIRLIELFAGIGSQAKRMERLGLDFETYRVCEWDKYCISSYNAIHGTDFGTSDITKLNGNDLGIVDTDKYCYVVTYSFPCQDLSLAGRQAGMSKGEGTRSGLLWEVERLLNECNDLPQILVMENVPQVHSKRNMGDFERWIEFLKSKGYSCFWRDLNAKNYGIPQNRNRCFMVSILGNYDYEFPYPVELQLRLKDMLESQVDEKYYIPLEKIKIIEAWEKREKAKGNGYRWNLRSQNDIRSTVTTSSERYASTTYINEDEYNDIK